MAEAVGCGPPQPNRTKNPSNFNESLGFCFEPDLAFRQINDLGRRFKSSCNPCNALSASRWQQPSSPGRETDRARSIGGTLREPERSIPGWCDRAVGAHATGVRLDIFGAAPTWQLLLTACELDCQRIDDIPHDFVLGRDDVGQVTIEPVGRKVPADLAIDELSRDTMRTGYCSGHAVHCH
jgi:hypothetical protein